MGGPLLIVVVVAGLCAAGSAALAGTSGAASPAIASPRQPVNGEQIGADPAVASGQLLQVAVPGFATGATVQFRLACPAPVDTVRADSHGVAHVRYVVPPALRAGSHKLVVSGPGPTPAGSTTNGSAGNVSAAIPRTAFVPFTVPGDTHSSPAADSAC